MVLTCCCRVAIIARSCSSLVWRGRVLKGVPPVAVVVGETLVVVMAMVMAMVMVIFPRRRMNSLLRLYL